MIKPDDISYMPSLPGKQRAALKRAYRALQAKRRGELRQFFWVKRPDETLSIVASYRRKQHYYKGEFVPTPKKRRAWVYVNTVYRFSIGVSGGYFLNFRPKKYFRLSSL